MSAGAYGFVMASNYNTRPLPAEVLVKGKQAGLVRQRQKLASIWRTKALRLARLTERDIPVATGNLNQMLSLEGRYDGANISANLRRQDDAPPLLISRGFHWINEFPFNH